MCQLYFAASVVCTVYYVLLTALMNQDVKCCGRSVFCSYTQCYFNTSHGAYFHINKYKGGEQLYSDRRYSRFYSLLGDFVAVIVLQIVRLKSDVIPGINFVSHISSPTHNKHLNLRRNDIQHFVNPIEGRPRWANFSLHIHMHTHTFINRYIGIEDTPSAFSATA